jgi:hypothetical protein
MTKRGGKERDVEDDINNYIIVHGSLFSFSRLMVRLMVVAKPKTNARIAFLISIIYLHRYQVSDHSFKRTKEHTVYYCKSAESYCFSGLAFSFQMITTICTTPMCIVHAD